MKKLLLLTFFASLLTPSLIAQPGSLDPTFADGGKLRLNLSNSSDRLKEVAVLPDGKILAFGEGYGGVISNYSHYLVRYATDGNPDLSFGDGGILVVEDFLSANAMAVQPDGKIIVAGRDFANFFLVMRFLPDGSPDPDFGADGVAANPPFANSFPTAKALALYPDGKIAVAGENQDWFLTVLFPDGSVDTSFGVDGISYADFFVNELHDLAIQPNGKLVVVGDAPFAFDAVRFNTDGSVDTAFGTDGLAEISPGRGQAVAIQPDGKIVVGGHRTLWASDSTEMRLVRFLPDGMPDPEFAPTPFPTLGINIFQNDLLLLPDGKILLSGFIEYNSQSDMLLLRYLPNGDLDPSFGNGGKATTDFSPAYERGTALALLPNGEILLGGISNYDFALQVFTADGNVNPDFNGGRLNLSEGDDLASTVAVQADGKIVVGGNNFANFVGQFLLAGFLPNGDLDESFSSNGQITQGDETTMTDLRASILQPDGKILACGVSASGTAEIGRFLPDGAADTDFGEDGFTEFRFMDGNDDYSSHCDAMALQGDGKILVGGYLSTFPQKFALARLLPGGSMDMTFGDNGQVLTEFSSDGAEIHGLAVQPDGKIIAGGYDGFIGNDQFALARYLPDGTLDSSFGNGGILTLLNGTRCQIRQLTIQPDGKILAVGSGRDDNNELRGKLLRLMPDGSPDPTFGQAGWLNISYGEQEKAWSDELALQPDGGILVGGDVTDDVSGKFALARFLPDGSPDLTFGDQGFVVDEILGQASGADALAIQPDGKVVLVGITADVEGSNFSKADLALARYLLDLDVGVLDFSTLKNTLLIYPNPIGAVATLEFVLPQPEAISLELFSPQGQQVAVFTKNKSYLAGPQSERLSFPAGLPAGVYFLKISNGLEGVSVRVFKK